MTAAKTTTKTTRKAPAARAPQDRKPKAAPKVRPEQIPGWHLLKPFAEIPVWDQADLYNVIMEIEQQHQAGGSVNEMRLIGDISRTLLPFAVDEAEFLAFVSGPSAMINAAPLVMAWVEQMGKAVTSAP